VNDAAIDAVGGDGDERGTSADALGPASDEVFERLVMTTGGICVGDATKQCWTINTVLADGTITMRDDMGTYVASLTPLELDRLVTLVSAPEFRAAIQSTKVQCRPGFDYSVGFEFQTSMLHAEERFAEGCIFDRPRCRLTPIEASI
jgi:hypothetical protein